MALFTSPEEVTAIGIVILAALAIAGVVLIARINRHFSGKCMGCRRKIPREHVECDDCRADRWRSS